MLSDEWLPRYRLLENFTAKWNGNRNGNGNGNAYDRGDYNSSFALRAVELKMGYPIEKPPINIQTKFIYFFELLLYVQHKQLTSCPHGSYPNHTVPGQAIQRQFTST